MCVWWVCMCMMMMMMKKFAESWIMERFLWCSNISKNMLRWVLASNGLTSIPWESWIPSTWAIWPRFISWYSHDILMISYKNCPHSMAGLKCLPGDRWQNGLLTMAPWHPDHLQVPDGPWWSLMVPGCPLLPRRGREVGGAASAIWLWLTVRHGKSQA